MKNPFTEHPQNTENPQTYIEHGYFAFKNSCLLVYAGIVGIIHAIFPFILPFTTSTIVIKAFKKLVKSRRHKKELKEHYDENI